MSWHGIRLSLAATLLLRHVFSSVYTVYGRGLFKDQVKCEDIQSAVLVPC